MLTDAKFAGPMLTTREVAEALALTERKVRNLVAEGRLPAARLGRRTMRFRREDVVALLVASGQPAAGEAAYADAPALLISDLKTSGPAR